MSKLWLSSTIAAGLTAYTFPHLRMPALQCVMCTSIVPLISKFSTWLRFKYPEYKRTHNVLSIIETLSQMGLLGYASMQLSSLAKNHQGLVGFVHQLASNFYAVSSSAAYFSCFFGILGSGIVMIMTPFIRYQF